MQQLERAGGVTVSWDQYGEGPPLVLVHGSFSDHASNWGLVRPVLEPRFTVHAVARRGRGRTSATTGHGLEDEGGDVAALLGAIAEPCFLVGHSYGAQVALLTAAAVPDRVRKLVLYEPPWPRLVSGSALAPLEDLGRARDWDAFAYAFFRDVLTVPRAALDEVRASEEWAQITADTEASLGDLRALSRYEFRAERFRAFAAPTLLQVGSESPRDLYVTDALAAALPDARVEELPGQAHEAMTTAPDVYAASLVPFLLT